MTSCFHTLGSMTCRVSGVFLTGKSVTAYGTESLSSYKPLKSAERHNPNNKYKNKKKTSMDFLVALEGLDFLFVMSMSVCLSARISPKPHGRISPNFCACCLWPRLGPPLSALRYVMYFRFSGWRHSSPYGARVYNSLNFCIDSNQILQNDKDQQVTYTLWVACRGWSLLSMFALFTCLPCGKCLLADDDDVTEWQCHGHSWRHRAHWMHSDRAPALTHAQWNVRTSTNLLLTYGMILIYFFLNRQDVY